MRSLLGHIYSALKEHKFCLWSHCNSEFSSNRGLGRKSPCLPLRRLDPAGDSRRSILHGSHHRDLNLHHIDPRGGPRPRLLRPYRRDVHHHQEGEQEGEDPVDPQHHGHGSL